MNSLPTSAYSVSVLTVLSLERTNFPGYKRAYITAHGGPFYYESGAIFIGATTAFVWDQSFVSKVFSPDVPLNSLDFFFSCVSRSPLRTPT
jgi:hypothetical protein